jgi:hypothetical protein
MCTWGKKSLNYRYGHISWMHSRCPRLLHETVLTQIFSRGLYLASMYHLVWSPYAPRWCMCLVEWTEKSKRWALVRERARPHCNVVNSLWHDGSRWVRDLNGFVCEPINRFKFLWVVPTKIKPAACIPIYRSSSLCALGEKNRWTISILSSHGNLLCVKSGTCP